MTQNHDIRDRASYRYVESLEMGHTVGPHFFIPYATHAGGADDVVSVLEQWQRQRQRSDGGIHMRPKWYTRKES